MSDFDSIEDAIENVVTLANCWLTCLPNFDCSTTARRVEEVVMEITEDTADDLNGYDCVERVEYFTRMHEAACALRDWLKFEHQTKPRIDLGFSGLRLVVNVADLNGTPKEYKDKTPMRLLPTVKDLRSKNIVFKIPFGHLMARYVHLETSLPDDTAAVATGEIELDGTGNIVRFEYPIDLSRQILRGRGKFRKALARFLRAAFGEPVVGHEQ